MTAATTYLRNDPMRDTINAILRSGMPHVIKMTALNLVEPLIEKQWKAGKTNVKPVSEMTADDLWI